MNITVPVLVDETSSPSDYNNLEKMAEARLEMETCVLNSWVFFKPSSHT